MQIKGISVHIDGIGRHMSPRGPGQLETLSAMIWYLVGHKGTSRLTASFQYIRKR